MLKVSSSPSLADQLQSRIELRTARVAVVGLGYVGLPLAETFAWAEFPVTGFDIDPEKVRKLRLGQSYIRHIASQRIVELYRSGRFQATTDPACFDDVDAIIICVPTPLTEAREPDLSYITNTGRAIQPHLRPGKLIVLESTTYPGTTPSTTGVYRATASRRLASSKPPTTLGMLRVAKSLLPGSSRSGL